MNRTRPTNIPAPGRGRVARAKWQVPPAPVLLAHGKPKLVPALSAHRWFGVLPSLGFALALSLSAASAADLHSALNAISGYQFGQAKENLHAARLAAFRGADDGEVRAANERLLLGFLESDASVDARREACLWLANLGTAASVPVLEALAEDERFADVANIALAEVKGERSYTASNKIAPTPPESDAMLGDDERAARMAFESIAANADTTEARAWLIANHSEVPPHRQIVAMNTLLRADAAASAEVVDMLTASEHPEVRNAAIAVLGSLGRPQDIPRLTAWLEADADEDESLQAAALAAWVAAPESTVRDALTAWLRGEDAFTQAKAIEIAAQRGASFAVEDLLRIAKDPANPNRKSAATAVAWASPPETFAEVVEIWIAAAGGEMEADWQTATWALARRQPDYSTAIRTLESRAAEAPPKARAAIHSMANRLKSALPEIPLDPLRGR